MGLAASQARWYLLIGRKSDIEYRGQQINNRRLLLMNQTEAIAKAYNEALTDRKIMIKVGNDSQLLSHGSQGGYTIMVRIDGADVPLDQFDTTFKDLPEDERAAMLQSGLRSGQYYAVNAAGETIDWRTESAFSDELNTDNDEAANAEYEYQSSILQNEDKKMELELKQLDSQHKAIETEIDAVKKVIDKNIETSFKTFA